MKLMTLLGKRSEIIKLSLILKVLDQHAEHVVVLTGETVDEGLSDVFFGDLEIRTPDIDLREGGAPIDAAQLTVKIGTLLREFSPERLLVMGSSMAAAALAAAPNMTGRVFQLDAGRSDAAKDINAITSLYMPFGPEGREALVLDGIPPRNILVVGNPIKEVHETFAEAIDDSGVMGALGVNPFDYFLATAHREENLAAPAITRIMNSLESLATRFSKTILFVSHPNTTRRFEELRLAAPQGIRLLRALNFFDFVKLEKSALAVISDSSSVQEECSILRVPNISLRSETARPETIACGGSMLAGIEAEDLLRAVEVSIAQPAGWEPPAQYLTPNVSQVVSKIMLQARSL